MLKKENSILTCASRLVLSCALGAQSFGCSSDDVFSTPDAATSPKDAAVVADAGRTPPGDAGTGPSDALPMEEPDASTPSGVGYYFDNDLEGFALGYSLPTELASTSTATWDATEGRHNPGSARIFANFSGGNQKLDLTLVLPTPLDLRGKSVAVSVKLASGLRATPPLGGAKIFFKSSASWVYADGGETSISANGEWFDIAADATNPAGYRQAGYDAADIRELGVELVTPYNEATPDVTPAMIFVDSFEFR